jgi:hypothetical protein
MFNTEYAQIADLAAESRLPAIYSAWSEARLRGSSP